jgi:WD40 repeat protein
VWPVDRAKFGLMDGAKTFFKLYESGKNIEHPTPAWNRVAILTALEWSPDGRLLATADTDGRAWVWDPMKRPRALGYWGIGPRNVEVARLVHEAKDSILRVAWSPDGRLLATAADKFAVVWDPRGPTRHATLKHDQPVNAIGWAPSGDLIATGTTGPDAKAIVWDAASHRELSKLHHSAAVTHVQFSPNSSSVLGTACVDGAARLWRVDRAAGRNRS